jgi:hypothetical protein
MKQIKATFKKILVVLLTLSISMVSMGQTVSATQMNSDSEDNSLHPDEYQVEVLEKNEEYSKIKITHIETDQVEYLESFLKDEHYEHIATIGQNQFYIEKTGDKIETTNLQTGEKTYRSIYQELDSGGNNNDQELESVELQYYYKHYKTRYMNSKIESDYYSLMLGYIATALSRAPWLGVVVGSANYYWSAGKPILYWIDRQYYYVTNPMRRLTITTTYKYNNYTGVIKTDYRYRIGP